MTNKQRIKYWIISLVLTILPIGYGVAVYDQLPARMAIHWGMHNVANGFVAKPIAVFGLPLLMVLFQIVMIGVTWLNNMRQSTAPRFERVTLAIMPVIAIVIYTTTIMINLGHELNVWKIAMLIIAFVFIGLGNYMPTVPPEYNRGPFKPNWRKHPEAWKKVSRQMGFVMVAGGVLCLISIFLNEWVSIAVLVLVVVGIMVVTLNSIRLLKK